jgi:hypothetical protein
METDIQGVEARGDEEMVIFFVEVDPRAIEDRKHLKFSRRYAAGCLEEGIAIRS